MSENRIAGNGRGAAEGRDGPGVAAAAQGPRGLALHRQSVIAEAGHEGCGGRAVSGDKRTLAGRLAHLGVPILQGPAKGGLGGN